jgi:hypothetical protein
MVLLTIEQQVWVDHGHSHAKTGFDKNPFGNGHAMYIVC